MKLTQTSSKPDKHYFFVEYDSSVDFPCTICNKVPANFVVVSGGVFERVCGSCFRSLVIVERDIWKNKFKVFIEDKSAILVCLICCHAYRLRTMDMSIPEVAEIVLEFEIKHHQEVCGYYSSFVK